MLRSNGYARPFHLLSIAAFLLASGAAGGPLAVANPAGSRGWPLVVLWLLLGFGLQALLRSLTPFTFENIFVSDLANSFYSVTRQVLSTVRNPAGFKALEKPHSDVRLLSVISRLMEPSRMVVPRAVSSRASC